MNVRLASAVLVLAVAACGDDLHRATDASSPPAVADAAAADASIDAIAIDARVDASVDADVTSPVVTGFDPPQARVGEPVRILGTRFAPFPNQNRVLVAGIEVQPLDGDAINLLIRLPLNIGGAPPVGSGDQKEIEIVVVTNDDRRSAPAKLLVGAPFADPPPKITRIDPEVGGDENAEITITGENFGASNTVHFDFKEVANVPGTATEIKVVVPELNIGGPGNFRLVTVTVVTGGRASDPLNYMVRGN